ncbi:hypothetical protein CEP51_009348 [Fusarium floridanum]|uniref:Rhodopsin domain-containing protein n=1 Tax=Fusarium floridanum TaxID=1325733 RepID=A0A428RHV0_9HYPO|nr:hypothetical protein CEP51_009348 [Fusarium floridanum]
MSVWRHLAVVLMENQDIFGKSMLGLFIGEFTYGTVLCTTKAAILLMYCLIFQTRFMKLGEYVLGGIGVCLVGGCGLRLQLPVRAGPEDMAPLHGGGTLLG